MNAEKTSCRFTSPVYRLLLFCSVAALALALMPTAASAQYKSKSDFCNALGKTIQASSASQMACFGVQKNGPQHNFIGANGTSTGLPNVNAATPAEDVTNGTRAYGQSEVSIAASGPYVVEAWNDSTGFFAPPCSPMNKDQLTGFGFSNNGGRTFTDLGGLPNANCGSPFFSKYAGDPSVVAYNAYGNTYFYISSLIEGGDCFFLCVAVDACQVLGSGSSATLSCNSTPVEIQDSSFFNIEDKDFATVDSSAQRLYISYTDFVFDFNGSITLAGCDITSPLAPVCPSFGSTYLVVDFSTTCKEQEGAYPAVDPATGDVYVAYEDNWATNLFGCSLPIEDKVAYIPASCLPTPPTFSTCIPPFNTGDVDIVSMDGAFVPGYNRFPANDFPRIAVSDAYGTVTMVWNDAGVNPLGDILEQSWYLGGAFTQVTSGPVKLNNGRAALHFLPALRNSSSTGLLDVTWFDRRLNPSSAKTDTFGALNVSPLITSTPSSNNRISNFSGDWNAVSSDIIPNFGDYTDNFVSSGSWGNTLFVAWADGRLGVPQPFEAHVGVH